MAEAPTSETISTRLQQIANRAGSAPEMAFNNLSHLIDRDLLMEAFRRTRKDGGPGVDGQTAAVYAVDLEANLLDLLNRVKTGRYRAPAVRRVHIPKDDRGNPRPIGIPTFEDKLLQRATAMLLSAIYEQDFYPCSYGFRPRRSAHQALQTLWEGTTSMGGGWVLEVDIRKFFDNLDHQQLRSILDLRVRDKGIRRLIGKWLNAGVLEGVELSYPEAGTPQGGVISPLLANVYLHEVLDKWFKLQVIPCLRGRAEMFRYADDFVIVFQEERDARSVAAVLPKRFAKYGLSLNEEKTRLVQFVRPSRSTKGTRPEPGTFDFLGFTHHWGLSRYGKPVVKRRTAKTRLRRALKAVSQWCATNRHLRLGEQQLTLRRKLQGHYNYYGITGNYPMLHCFHQQVIRVWKDWLNSRSQKPTLTWEKMWRKVVALFPMPKPRVVKSVYA